MNDRQKIATLSTFRSMHARCTDKTHPGHKYYVSKGIAVCERWSVFENFLEDMGHRPEGKTIDRIDGDKGYYKENCRWATPTEQNRNLSSNKLSFNTAVEVAIRRLRGERCEDIAALYEIGKSMPRDIVKGRAWHDAVEAAKRIIEVGNAAMDEELQRLRNSASSPEHALAASRDATLLDDATVDMWMNGIGGGVWIDRKLTLRPDELKSVIRGIASLATKRAALTQQSAAQAPLDAKYEVIVDRRDLFDAVRNAWREGQSGGDCGGSTDTAENWHAATDYADGVIRGWSTLRAAQAAHAGAMPEHMPDAVRTVIARFSRAVEGGQCVMFDALYSDIRAAMSAATKQGEKP